MPEREFPTGKGGELERYAGEHYKEKLVQFAEVKNTVDWVNPDFPHLPFKLEEGKPTPLGMFAEASFPTELHRRLQEKPSEARLLEVSPEHGRSALLGRFIFQDAQGRLYRDIDLKGIGMLDFPEAGGVHVTQPGHELEGGRKGMLDYNLALYDRDMSEAFLRAGIRTSRTLTIIKPEELIVDGEKLDIEKAEQRELLTKDFVPAIEVRAFGTKARIQDAQGIDKDMKRELLEDARLLVSQELGKGENPLSYEEYINWFAETLGQNVALMHKNGWHHDFLTEHNITLDSRIVDLDSVSELTTNEDREHNCTIVRGTLNMFASRLCTMGRGKFSDLYFQMSEAFTKQYDETFSPKERKKYFANLGKNKETT